MGLSPRTVPGGARRRRAAGTAFLSVALAATGLVLAPPASTALPAECDVAFPLEEVTAGQAVHGLTVTSGTEPEPFSGSVVGVLDDYIAPDVDMILVRLTSAEIDRVRGIWQGMSGSPVYDSTDGRLLGAVSYGLALGPSTLAGLTPASEMLDMFTDPASEPLVQARRTVMLPSALSRQLVSSGVAEPAEVAGGLSRLPIPLALSGVRRARVSSLSAKLGLKQVRPFSTGGVSATAETTPIVAGGNVAASMSYGDVSALGVGTATSVCGNEVVAFGHPMNFTGPSQMTLHGAKAVTIQEDPVSAPFKLANPTAPLGAVTQDRLGGLHGVQDPAAIPTATPITSYAAVVGGKARRGTTHISVPDVVPELAATHLMANQDRVFDAQGPGSATTRWTITGKRADGRLFSLTRGDRYASMSDISSGPAQDLYTSLAALHGNESENITIDHIATTTTLDRTVRSYRISGLQVRRAGRWVSVRPNVALAVTPGATLRLRVALSSRVLGSGTARVDLVVPRRLAWGGGTLEVIGGNSWNTEGGEGGEDGLGAPSAGVATVDAILGSLRAEPRNDQVVATVRVHNLGESQITRTRRARTGAVINGGFGVELVARRAATPMPTGMFRSR